ncbi:MAG: alkaline phosphatase family protein [Candidatus Omnitrophica bacterium]|nr:alkaline phosphatase family protein [Candidatus Omnitrophota bacterium]
MRLSIKSKSKGIILVILSITLIFLCVTGHPFFKKNKTKILLIGMDGATWTVMRPLINDGKLPNIKQLMDKGCWGNLESFYPLTSEVIWTSIATGKSPDKHGITDRIMEDPDTGELVPPTTNLIKVRTIWNILSERKKKVGIIGYRMSWPPEEVNGVMVSDRSDISQYLSKDYSYPPFKDLCSELEFENFGKVNNSIFSCIDRKKKGIYFDYSVEEQDNFMSNFSEYLLQKQDFDFFSVYLLGIDVLSHHFWKYLFPEGLEINEEDKERYKDIINDYYIYCDSVIGDLLKKVDKDTTVIIVSDHGFRESPRKDYYIFSKLNLLLEASGLSEIKMNSKKAFIKDTLGEIIKSQRGLRIDGDLSNKEFIEVREWAKEILRDIKVKETNHSIFSILEDTKTGFIVDIDYIYINEHPEHHILIKGKEVKIMDFLSPYSFCGGHDKLGVIMISGKNIYQNKTIETATIYDITPTILYLMGLPVGKDMKGKVLVEAIDSDLLRRRPTRYIDTYETHKKEKIEKPIRSPQDEERIIERMKSLGYIN